MQIDITGHHIDVTDSMKQYVNDKFEKLERHFDHVTDIHVILTVEKLRQQAEATMHISGGKLFADAEDENMYAAIDSLVSKLDRQVKKHKEKRTDHRQAEGALNKTREIE